MKCPKCGSTEIHRSRRRGFAEGVVLGAIAVFPYRCSACCERFLKHRPGERRRLAAIVRDPPPWLRAIAWAAFVAVVALAIGLFAVSYVSQHRHT